MEKYLVRGIAVLGLFYFAVALFNVQFSLFGPGALLFFAVFEGPEYLHLYFQAVMRHPWGFFIGGYLLPLAGAVVGCIGSIGLYKYREWGISSVVIAVVCHFFPDFIEFFKLYQHYGFRYAGAPLWYIISLIVTIIILVYLLVRRKAIVEMGKSPSPSVVT
jgi:hypothetical protein